MNPPESYGCTGSYSEIKETLSVLHLHPTYCVAAMHAGYNLCDIITPFPEVYRYTKVGPNVPAVQATSMDLVEKLMKKCVQT